MTDTTHLDITELEQNQGQPEVTINEALAVLDCAALLNVIDIRTSPPSHTEGNVYLIGATGATGAWSGQEDKIACSIGAAWHYLNPVEGWEIRDRDTNSRYLYDSTGWVRTAGEGDQFATVNPSASYNLDFEVEKQYWDLNANVTTLGTTNLPAAGQARTVDVLVDLNTYTITWPATSVIDWGTAGAPTQNTNKLLWMRFIASSSKAFAFSLGEFTP